MRRGRRWVTAVALLLGFSAIAMMAGCGNGAGAPTEATGDTSPKHPARGRLIVPPRLPKGAGRQGCVSATASVGHDPRVITIAAHCIGQRPSRPGNITIGRYVATNPIADAAIAAYTPQVRDLSRGTGIHLSQCQREMSSVSCIVPGVGQNRVQIKIWVPQHTRCSAEVSAVTVRAGICSAKPCIGSKVIYTLFRGRPRGC